MLCTELTFTPLPLQGWRQESGKENFLYDQTSTWTSLLIVLLALSRIKIIEMAPYDIVLGSIGIAQYLGLGILLSSRHHFYIRWRERILIPHAILTLLIFCCFSLYRPQFSLYHPLEMPTSGIKAVLYILFLPAILLRHSASYMFATDIYLPLSVINASMVLFTTACRCSAELAAVPGQGQKYLHIANAIDQSIYRRLPFSFRPSDDPVGVSAVSDSGACLAIHGTAQLVIGYFLPWAIFYSLEQLSRKSFRKKYKIRGRGTSQHPFVLFLQHLLLMPFLAMVLFHTSVFVLTTSSKIIG